MSEAGLVRLTGKITEADYVRAQWLHLRPRPFIASVGMVLIALVLVMGVVQVARWMLGSLPASEAFMLPSAAAVLLAYFAFLSWNFKRSYREYKAIQMPASIELSEAGFHASSEHGETRLPWDMFRKYKENKHLFLIYQSGALFHLLPKRLFASEAEVERAREIVMRHVRSGT